MSPEKHQELKSVYLEVFEKPPKFSCISVFGFECGDGWFHIIKKLLQDLKPMVEKEPVDEDFPMVLQQVKEKWGTLRFYMSCSTDEIDNVIREAENRSSTTCECCGQDGSLRNKNRWLRVRCDECFRADCATT